MGRVFGCGLGMFLSTIEGSIDARGRVLVPSSFRAVLGGVQKFYLYPSATGAGYLEGGGQSLMEEYVEIFQGLPPLGTDRLAFVNAIFSKGGEVSMDQAGRASISPQLLKVAGITDKLLFVGAMDRFQIWSPERYAEFDAEMTEYTSQNRDALARPYQEMRGKWRGGDL